MNRNLQISKETEDRVKLAKKLIEDKYQNMIKNEIQQHRSWQRLIDKMIDNQLTEYQKELVTTKILEDQIIIKRLQRQSDCLKNYELYNIIGRGAFGEVRLAKNILKNEIVAIKRLQKKKICQKKQIYNSFLERDFMIKNKSPFIVNLLSTFQDDHYLYMVMEYVPGGDLLHLLIQKDILTEDETRFYIGEMILAVEQIHLLKYIHRDIKPDNVLIDARGHVKISDFGLSKYLQNFEETGRQPLRKMAQIKKHMNLKQRKRCYSKVGTPDYISPEVLTQQTYDYKVDIWGVGVVMFQCLYGFPPFANDDSKEVCHRVVNWLQYLQFPDQTKVSTEAKMLMLGMMSDKGQRLTIKQIKTHPFFKHFDWKNIREKQSPNIPLLRGPIDTRNFDKYDQEDEWVVQQKFEFNQRIERNTVGKSKDLMLNNLNQQRKTHFRGRASSLEGKGFIFAGFNYRKLDIQQNALKNAQKTIKQIVVWKSNQQSRQKYKKKTKQKGKDLSPSTFKRLKTDGSEKENREIIRHKKMRGSVERQDKENKVKQFMGTRNMNKINVKKKLTKGY